MKNGSKNIILDHFWLKMLAILLSIIIWLIVMNVEDYTVTKQIKGIPVEQLNGDVIEELDKVYDVTEGETVDIVIKGRRTLVDTLTVDDFVATADLSQMSITNTVQIVVTPKNRSVADEISITYVNNTMVLSIEDKITEQLPVTVVTTGDVAEGYALGSCSATPNIVTLEGPRSVVEKVTEVHAVVDVSNQYESFETEVEPLCYDIYGESISNKKVTLDTDMVKVSVPIYSTKEIPINIQPSGTVMDGYVITNINYHPQTIRVAGDEKSLGRLSELKINDIVVSRITESMEVNVQVSDYLPDGIYLADTNQQIAVSITVEKLEEREFSPTAGDIRLLNQNNDYQYEIVFPEGYSFRLKGLHEDLDGISLDDLAPSLDCAELGLGSHQLLLILTESDAYSIINDMEIEVIVSKKPEDETEETFAEGDSQEEPSSE